jgi:hypothetical protein
MKNPVSSLFIIIVIVVAALAIPAAAQATDDTLSWQIRGFNYPSWWYDEYLGQSSSDSLSRVAATGANWVAIDPSQYMNTVTSNAMAPENGGAGRTASDTAVAKAIDDAHARGLKVMLKPHIDISDGNSRWDIRPTNPSRWFGNYKNMMVSYGTLAEAHHVELVAVGTELVTMSGPEYSGYWTDVIAGVHSVYGGPITYAASTTECDYLSFADQLDYLGLDVYFPLSDSAEPTLDELIAGWTDYHGYYGVGNWVSSVEQCQANFNKPVIFTELGFRSVRYVGLSPWDWSAGVYDGNNQARAYEAAFRVLGNKPWLAGVFWWDWMPGADTGGPGNTDYTIVDKPAEDVVKTWFALGQVQQQPELHASENWVRWNSYADYTARNLSVGFTIDNTGSGQAADVTITGSHATDGVRILTTLPVSLGSLAPGGAIATTMTYRVPAGVTSFQEFIYIECLDTSGHQHSFPMA